MRMDNPLISILIPVYNCEPYLRECLDSVVAQTYRPLQVVCVNDGSSDGSLSILKEYSTKYDFIEVISQENKGVATARNRLLEAARGEYILFVDADDWIEPDTIDFLAKQAETSNVDVATCSMVVNDTNVKSEFYSKILNQSEVIKEFLYHTELRGSLWNKLIKRTIIGDAEFNPGIWYGEDALFCWHIFQNLKTMIMTDKQLYHYRMNDSSISHQTFGAKKLTGHETWRIINEETAEWWPQYLPIAKARWGVEDYHLLMQAGAGKYKLEYSIKTLQKTVRLSIFGIKKFGFLKGRDIFNAHLVSCIYAYGYVYYKLHHLKNIFQ